MQTQIPARFFQMLQEVWGFSKLRESQVQAVAATLAGNDALVVVPTGGGKSLCYQAPAVFRGGVTIVISPLIALMKDQVDSLKQLGIPAARWDSSLTPSEKRFISSELNEQKIRLLFASPERAVQKDFPDLFCGNNVHSIAIDEAHCVSQWGHDFRPEYRNLLNLRNAFPNASMMALTATATEQVQHDIVNQLQLRNPSISVHSFDRPNLTYRIVPKESVVEQCCRIIDRHKCNSNPNHDQGASNDTRVGGIIYCLRRTDVDQLTSALKQVGYSAIAYHAGLSNEERQRAQEAFMKERVDVVVATIAFGMGIDRSNVRFVIHTSIPKSMENYQQETGRAGRDGLNAECTLLFSMRDATSITKLIEKSAVENQSSPEWIQTQLKNLQDFVAFCKTPCCRHRSITEYFGQNYSLENCNACDYCLGELDIVKDSKIIAQKIISCVHRMGERFGINAIADVLIGSNALEIQKRGHQSLSTFGILKEFTRKEIRNWIEQLVGLNALCIDGQQYPVLKLGPKAKAILFGSDTPVLTQLSGPIADNGRKSLTRFLYDQTLFYRLREWRHETASQIGVAPSILFPDYVLAELSAKRPSTIEAMRSITGIGEQQLQAHGLQILEAIRSYCEFKLVPMDQPLTFPSSALRSSYDELFRTAKPLAEIATLLRATEETVTKFLVDAILAGEVSNIDPWVPPETTRQICSIADKLGGDRLKPIFEELQGKTPYSAIRLAMAIRKSGALQKVT
jgi:ATP-dependent DNA helicase RecQ